jgi:hypothetical protein
LPIRPTRKLSIGVAAALLVAVASIVAVYFATRPGGYDGTGGGNLTLATPATAAGAQLRAVIVDQLGDSVPDPQFILDATSILEAAGYGVDYVPESGATVDYYRTLPSQGYQLVVLRSHSARRVVQGTSSGDATLFTSETYDENKYVDELHALRLGVVQYDDGRPGRFFGIRPAFVERDMQGTFDASTLVILMGCDGLRNDRLASAFVNKGAGGFVSWDKPVTSTQTDLAVALLIKKLVDGTTKVSDAVKDTMATVGPDPAEGAVLAYYPR